ncbi:hypothetical protein [Bdellovibrio sp. HCB209]|uniref:hypothetical protein n=1 Tax=Bdellovibrio sp. HCB209 TaxID=3394354 RepID=UPI0039B52B5E
MTLSITTSCGTENVLSEMSNKESDAAYFIDAKKKLDEMEWDSTISIVTTKMSATYQGRRDVKMILASAYAGKCGLIFVDLIHGMTNNTATELFQYFMGIWGGRTVNPDSCESAIAVLQGIGPAASRTTNENLFLALLGVARIGTNLSAKLDAGTPDGAKDADATVCDEDQTGNISAWPDPTPLPPFPAVPPGLNHYLQSSDVKRVAAGLGLVFENITALTDALGGGTTIDAIGDMGDACDEALQAIAGPSASCSGMVTPDDVSDEMVYAMRVMMDTSDFGFGVCSIDDTATFITDFTATPATTRPGATVCCRTAKPPGVP